jgi:tRNA(Ile)-lysidine synthase TilS/MesJ
MGGLTSMRLNYLNWRNEHKSILETFPNKKVLMLYTGGKDSSIILHFLLLAGKEFGFEFDTIAATYPNHVFQDIEIRELDAYWRSKNVDIQWHNLNTSDSFLSDAETDGKNPCYVCHKIKRNYLLTLLQGIEQHHKDIVVILSFTLWDLVSYTIEYLVGGIYSPNSNNENHNEKSPEQRFIETSQRFYPVIHLKDGLTIFKPLLKYNDNEISRIVSEEKIPLSHAVCTYKRFTPKRILSDYYYQINADYDYDNVLKYAKSSLKLNEIAYYTDLAKDDFIKNVL